MIGSGPIDPGSNPGGAICSNLFIVGVSFFFMLGVTLFIIAVLVIAIWVILEVKRLKHRLFAIIAIGAILFFYFSGLFVFAGEDIEWASIDGVIEAGKIYAGWLISVAGNFVEITNNAISLDWEGDKSGNVSLPKWVK